MFFTRSLQRDPADSAPYPSSPSSPSSSQTSLPAHLASLLTHLQTTLLPLLPHSTHSTLFSQPLARQAILNLYPPGLGITPHIDLAHRYADGIVGVSLIGGCTMTFSRSTSADNTIHVSASRGTHEAQESLQSQSHGSPGLNGSHGSHPRSAHGAPDPLDSPQPETQPRTVHQVYLPSRTIYVLTSEARWKWAHGITARDRDLVDGREILRDTRVSCTFRYMKEGADILS